MNELDFTIKEAVNEPIKGYLPGSEEKTSLKAKLDELKSQTFDIPIIINGRTSGILVFLNTAVKK